MKKYYKVAHANVVTSQKSKELNSDELTEILDNFINWKYEDSCYTDLNIEQPYFHNDDLNIDNLYFDDDIIANKLFERLYTFYTNKLEADKCLDIGDYDIIIKEDTNNDK